MTKPLSGIGIGIGNSAKAFFGVLRRLPANWPLR